MSNLQPTNNQVAVTDEILLGYMDSVGIAKDLSNEQKKQFIEIAKAFQLNPFKREIYAVKYGNTFNVITGYEVYLKRAERTGLLDGFETKLTGNVEKKKVQKTNNKTGSTYQADVLAGDLACAITIWRKDRSKPTTKTIYLEEFAQDSPIWLAKPRFMLEKCAIAVGFRLAFPDEFGGMPYTKEEMPIENAQIEQIDSKLSNASEPQPTQPLEIKQPIPKVTELPEKTKLFQMNEETGDTYEMTIEQFRKVWTTTSLATYIQLVASGKHKEYSESLNDNEKAFIKENWLEIKRIAATLK